MQTITKEVRTRYVTISPEDAREVWEEQQQRISSGKCRQRQFRASIAERYAVDMRSGAWAETHQGIAFDADGNLIDGQHRIYAIIVAGVPVRIMVTTGLPRRSGRIETIDSIDGGRVRSNADKLHMHGVTNANLAAASVTCIAVGVDQSVMGRTLSYTQANDIFHIYGNYIQDAIHIVNRRNALRKAYIVGPLAFAFAGCSDLGHELASKLSTLEGLTAKSPISALNKAIEDKRLQMIGTHRIYTNAFKVFASCLYGMHEGISTSRIMPNAEAFEWFMQTQPANVKKIVHIVNGYK